MTEKKGVALFSEKLQVINIGLDGFGHTLQEQGVPVAMLDWRPPAGGDPELIKIIDHLRSDTGDGWQEEITRANAEAISDRKSGG